MQSLTMNLIRRMWIAAIVVVAGFVFHPSAFAEQCVSYTLVDSTYSIEQEVCIEANNGWASVETFDDGYYEQESDPYYMQDFGNEVAACGYSSCVADTGFVDGNEAVATWTPVHGSFNALSYYYLDLAPSGSNDYEWYGPYSGLETSADTY